MVRLLAVARIVICLWSVAHFAHSSRPQGNCTFTDCIYRNLEPRHSLVEEYIFSLNLTSIPDSILDHCSDLKAHIAGCESSRVNCPFFLQQPFENRLHDYVYVDYLLHISTYICEYVHDIKVLRTCIRRRLQRRLHLCVNGFRLDASCALTTFSKRRNRCPAHTAEVFNVLVDNFLRYYPYSRDPSNCVADTP